jgi:pseudouridine kinase
MTLTNPHPTDHDGEGGGFVLLVGAAGIDVKGRPHAPLKPEAASLGRVRNSLGGVARNIAENLARLDVATTLLSAVGEDAEGDRVLRETSNRGVNCDYTRRVPDARTASNLALLRDDGQLHFGVSDFEIASEIDSDYLLQHEFLFATADMVVVDATLPEDTLETLFELTTRYGRRVCADPTTPDVAVKLRPYLSKLYLVVPNHLETRTLCEIDIEDAADDTQEREVAQRIASALIRAGVEIAVVTLGIRGLVYAHSSGSGYIRAANVEVTDPTGAGDAFSAAVIFGLLNGVPVDEAMRLGATAAALTVSTKETVYPELDIELLYDELVT